jgi:hypothetical protein
VREIGVNLTTRRMTGGFKFGIGQRPQARFKINTTAFPARPGFFGVRPADGFDRWTCRSPGTGQFVVGGTSPSTPPTSRHQTLGRPASCSASTCWARSTWARSWAW